MLSGTVSRWPMPAILGSAERNPLCSNQHPVTAPDPASAFSASGRRSRHREHQRPPSRRRPTSNVRRPAGAISTSSNPPPMATTPSAGQFRAASIASQPTPVPTSRKALWSCSTIPCVAARLPFLLPFLYA